MDQTETNKQTKIPAIMELIFHCILTFISYFYLDKNVQFLRWPVLSVSFPEMISRCISRGYVLI